MKTKSKSILNTFDNHNHLDAENISRYAEAMHSGKMDTIPEYMVTHIENCSHCHNEVVELFSVLHKIELQSGTPGAEQKEEKVFYINPVLRLALVASVAALAIFTYFRINSTTQNIEKTEIIADTTTYMEPAETELADEKKQPRELPSPPINNDQKKEKKTFHETTSPKQLYATNFIPADDYEALIGTTFRSNAIKVVSPENGSHFKKQELITFSWDLENSEFLYITILNNREEIISRQQTSVAEHREAGISMPGLYYWKLENEQELLYVGKFYIDN